MHVYIYSLGPFTKNRENTKEAAGGCKKILTILESYGSNSSSQSGTASAVPDWHIINERNVMAMPSRDGFSFALDLLDMLFTPEEMSGCLLYDPKPSKSSKKGLERGKVSCIATFNFPLL